MQLISNGHLVFTPPDPVTIKALIPHAKEVQYKGQNVMVVPHQLEEVKLLRNVGVTAPSPINHGWKYPGLLAPFTHQKITADFLTIHPRCFVFSTMGTGKTKNALWAAEYLMQQGLVHRVLIVCPRSCMWKVWSDEIFQTVTHRSSAVLHAGRGRDGRRSMIKEGSEYLIINHDGIKVVDDVVAKDPTIDLIIVDEASAFINAQTDRYKSLKSMIRPTTRLWLLTGTPVPNAPCDAWALSKLVCPSNVPQYFIEFKRQTMIMVNTFKWFPKPEAYELAYAAMQPAIRFTKEQCLDLPPVVYTNREVPLTTEQNKAYLTMVKDFVITTQKGEVISAANAAVKLSKLLQIACGAVYDENGDVVRINAAPRFEVLKELIEQTSRKVIVFVPFKGVVKQVVEEVEKYITVAAVTGDTSDKKRKEIFEAFEREKEPRVLVAHPKVAAHGLTLVAADTTIWFAPIFSSELYLQANERMNRPGQKFNMSVVHLGGTAAEWGAYDVVRTKVGRQDKILDMYRQVLTGVV